MRKETTYGLSPKQLARLLAIGLEPGDDEDDLGNSRTPAEVLRDMLESKLPLDPAMPDSLPAILNRPCDELLPVAGRTMLDLLLDSKPDLAVVKTLKDYGKELVRGADSQTQKAAVTAIYYAAIACALVFHQNKVTQHSYGKLEKVYEDLEQKKWIPSELKDLVRKAEAVCQQRKGKTR